jgi:hypothetical protein
MAAVDRDPTYRRQRLDHRDDPPCFLGVVDRLGPRAGGFAADIDHVGPFREQRSAPFHGGVAVEPEAAIREGVGRHVENAHYKCHVAVRLGPKLSPIYRG